MLRVLQSYKPISDADKSYLESLGAIIHSIPDLDVYYVYFDVSDSDAISNALSSFSYLSLLDTLVKREDVDVFLSSFKSDITLGSWVRDIDFGNIPFKVVDINGSQVSLYTSIRGLEFIHSAKLNNLVIHPNPLHFLYNNSRIIDCVGVAILDLDYIVKLRGGDLNSLILALYYFKSINPNVLVSIMYSDTLFKTHLGVRDFINIFNFPRVFDFNSASIIVSDLVVPTSDSLRTLWLLPQDYLNLDLSWQYQTILRAYRNRTLIQDSLDIKVREFSASRLVNEFPLTKDHFIFSTPSAIPSLSGTIYDNIFIDGKFILSDLHFSFPDVCNFEEFAWLKLDWNRLFLTLVF